ncbi:MAG TPA: T9SS type A sorting domain-containing protein [Hanamia sp.]
MGSRAIQRKLWGQRPGDWVDIQEKIGRSDYDFVLSTLSVTPATKLPGRHLLRYALAIQMIILAGNLSAQNTTIMVQEGNIVNVTGGFTVLDDVDLHCNGQWKSSGGVTSFTGDHNTSVGGSGTIRFWTSEIAKSQTTTLTLNGGLIIGNALDFKGGLIDLNGQELQLADTARLLEENDLSRIMGFHGGTVVASATSVNAPSQFNAGNVGAMLTSSVNLGNLTVIRSPMPVMSGGTGIQRNYLIQPQNNTALNATLRFYYLDAELNGNDATALNLWKSTDGITWTFIGADTRDTSEHYVEKSGITDLSYWTLADIDNPLPLTLISFSAVCVSNYTLIEWKTGVESMLKDFLVQRSMNGTDWSTLGTVGALNAASGAQYSFKDAAPQANCFYRLRIEDQDGKVTYSPVFRGGCSDITLPFLVYPNPVVSQAVAKISLRQAATGKVQVLSISGQSLYEAEWRLQAGLNELAIPVSGWPSGSYLVRLVLSGGVQSTQFIKL